MANSAKRDPNGTWHIQYRYTDWTGKKRKSSKKGFRTKKEAYKMSRLNVQKILYKNVQLICRF